ncbi:glycosyltransferase family 9 protein [Paraburkholderia sp. Ac-20340]|uniref:glycosyltransferase family 9 protein n=1 Tax=Paraburkholderia sp. Ac-20340 TaxID=2703888 RepID=UPI00198258DD|nr:hypothetical protein [Paraburkholderia sp. Ac-20340]MBN3856256.1 glycosyltransferase family 9 protein [Paraburkholderia sp. Ac-20340]
MLKITIEGANGIGDKLQFSSFPENYWRNTGQKIIDADNVWVFDYNPYVVRGESTEKPINLWEQRWPAATSISLPEYEQKPFFTSIASRTSEIFGHSAYLRHPRLYQFEDLPTLDKRIVIHTTGKRMPIHVGLGEDRERYLSEEIIDHIRKAYAGYEIIQVGSTDDIDARVVDCRGMENIWDVARLIAQARVFIGVDSGPYWIASCYPKVFRKKVLMQYPAEYLRNGFVPMHIINPHTHWHDHSCLYFNRTTEDAGISYGYVKL